MRPGEGDAGVGAGEAEARLLAYARSGPAAEPFGALAAAAGLEVFACARALLALERRGLLAVIWLGEDRFSLAAPPRDGSP